MIKPSDFKIVCSRNTTALRLLLIAVVMLAHGPIARAQWAGGTDIYNTNSGNVGIGTYTPSQKLEVNGALSIYGGNSSFLAYDRMASGASAFYRTGGITRFWDSEFVGGDVFSYDKYGKVGIGTTTPSTKLAVANGTTFAPDSNVLGALTLSGSFGGGLIFRDTTKYAGVWAVGDGRTLAFGSNGTSSGFGDSYGQMALTDGKLGIGTGSPGYKLHVVGDAGITGDITVSGNIAAKYQDLAEWVPAARSIAAGIVVILDPDGKNTVIPSSESYDTRVAGVVSATPGIVLGEAGENKVKVATTGRVKVRVDATRLPIRTGDLLVTSDREGVAMKSEPIEVGGRKIHQPGTLIGKALEPLSEGEGEILVLLSLQ